MCHDARVRRDTLTEITAWTVFKRHTEGCHNAPHAIWFLSKRACRSVTEASVLSDEQTDTLTGPQGQNRRGHVTAWISRTEQRNTCRAQRFIRGEEETEVHMKRHS